MDIIDESLPERLAPLSYDENVSYEDQISTATVDEASSLAKRIGSTKVYLLSESTAATRVGKSYPSNSIGKRKYLEEDVTAVEDEEMDEDTIYRPNALLLQGSPVADLPTARIFAYATHFDAHPMALEWIDDITCVLVFESKTAARVGFQRLQKSPEEEFVDELVTAKPIPIALWPAEKRINNSLGKGEGLKGIIQMRWARIEDVKQKGAKHQSEFYRKHGETAGKELYDGRDLPPAKRRRSSDIDEMEKRARLDDELDEFLNEDSEPEEPPSPPSKMRSDYIASDGRTLLDRTSMIRAHPEADMSTLASRLTDPPSRQPRSRQGDRYRTDDEDSGLDTAPQKKVEWGRGDRWSRGNRRETENRRQKGRRDRPTRTERPAKTQQELDDELDAFLNTDK